MATTIFNKLSAWFKNFIYSARDATLPIQVQFYCLSGSVEPRNFSDIKWSEFSLEDLQSLSFERMLDSRKKAAFAARIEMGHRVFGYRMLTSNEAIAYFWLTYDQHKQVHVPFEFDLKWSVEKCRAYIWDCKVHPEFRRKGIYTAGLIALSQFACVSGAKAIEIYCSASNLASANGIVRAGFAATPKFWIGRIAKTPFWFAGSKLSTLRFSVNSIVPINQSPTLQLLLRTTLC